MIVLSAMRIYRPILCLIAVLLMLGLIACEENEGRRDDQSHSGTLESAVSPLGGGETEEVSAEEQTEKGSTSGGIWTPFV